MINLGQNKRKKEKKDTYECVNVFQRGRELSLNAFKSEIFTIKVTRKKTQKINS